MSRKVVRLTLDHLAQLEGPCRSCVFWQLDPVSRGRLEGEEEAAGEKEAWVSEVLREWGSCGRVVLVDDEPAGFLVYAPAAYLPGAGQFATAPVSPDAVLLTHVWAFHVVAVTGVPRDKLEVTVGDLGNMASASIGVQLGRVRPGLNTGDRVLLVGLGGGVSLMTMVWEVS